MTDRAPVRWSKPEPTFAGWATWSELGEMKIDALGRIWMTFAIPPGYTLSDCLEGEALLRKAAQGGD